MNTVIGGVTSLLFTQLALLALPLRLALGKEYAASNVMTVVIEQSMSPPFPVCLTANRNRYGGRTHRLEWH